MISAGDPLGLASASKDWNFDVSSLIVLIGDELEHQYRLSQRSLLHCISAAPVVGLQNYIRPYDFLYTPANVTYTSPYGCKSAPLRNVRLENAIRRNGLLEDGKFSVYDIPASQVSRPIAKHFIILNMWIASTWGIFTGLIIFTIFTSNTTWVGMSNLLVLTGWSILLRLAEWMNLRPSAAEKVSDPDAVDAIFILGRDNSAFVLRGSRQDVKNWTSRGLSYHSKDSGCFASFTGCITRVSSLLVLLFVFSTIPNGSTMDQLVFVVLNALAQINVLLGQSLNTQACLTELDLNPSLTTKTQTRTHVFGHLMKLFKDVQQDNDWVTNVQLLPQTNKWNNWRDEFLKDSNQDPKSLYDSLNTL